MDEPANEPVPVGGIAQAQIYPFVNVAYLKSTIQEVLDNHLGIAYDEDTGNERLIKRVSSNDSRGMNVLHH
jgi:hypothetical protein